MSKMYKKSLALAALNAVHTLADPSLSVYWGQTGTENLASYCSSTGFEYVLLAFVNQSPEQDPSGSGYPGTNFGAHCWADVYTYDNEPTLLNSKCINVAQDIPTCQALGKKVLLSIGGEVLSGQNYTVSSAEKGVEFADFLWGAFGPYDESWTGPRPFDYNGAHTAVDGFDFDLESPTSGDSGYIALIQQLRQHYDASGGNYLISGAPQCPVSSGAMLNMISSVAFDMLFIQFYNNPACDAIQGDLPYEGFNYNAWEAFISDGPSSAAKLFIGLPGSPDSASSGYLEPDVAVALLQQYANRPSFGGAMIWDVTTASNLTDSGLPYFAYLHDGMLNANASSSPLTCSKYYLVAAGDSCWSIGQTHNLTTAEVEALNPSLDATCDIYIGQAVCVQGPTGSPTSDVSLPLVKTTETTPASLPIGTGIAVPSGFLPIPPADASSVPHFNSTPMSRTVGASSGFTIPTKRLSTAPHPTGSGIAVSSGSGIHMSSSVGWFANSTSSIPSRSLSRTVGASSGFSIPTQRLSTAPCPIRSGTAVSSGSGIPMSSSVGWFINSTYPVSSILRTGVSSGALPTSSAPSAPGWPVNSTWVPIVISTVSTVSASFSVPLPASTASAHFLNTTFSRAPTGVSVVSSAAPVSMSTVSPLFPVTTLPAVSEVVSTIYTSSWSTIYSCAETVTNCPYRSSSVLVTVPVATTTLSVGPSQSGYTLSESTSTIYSTQTYTVISCAETVTNCPARNPVTTTRVLPVSTTVHTFTLSSSGSSPTVSSGSGSSSGSGTGASASASASESTCSDEVISVSLTSRPTSVSMTSVATLVPASVSGKPQNGTLTGTSYVVPTPTAATASSSPTPLVTSGAGRSAVIGLPALLVAAVLVL